MNTPQALPRPTIVYDDPDNEATYPPWNFSWVMENELACMAWPQNLLNLRYLYEVGIRHLVTLSAEKVPPVQDYQGMTWTLIPVDEFEPPTIKDIVRFMDVCDKARSEQEAVGVHCRMGRGRTGVMAACYLVRYEKMAPEMAISKLRLTRPHSVETSEQERVVVHYADFLHGTVTPYTKEALEQSVSINGVK